MSSPSSRSTESGITGIQMTNRRMWMCLYRTLIKHRALSTLKHYCISDVRSWCSSRRLQLNTDKTQLIWFASRQIMEKVSGSNLTLQLDSGILKPDDVVRDLGVPLDTELSVKQHITRIASNCFYHLRRL